MARYLSLEEVIAAGYEFEHLTNESRFVLTKDGAEFATVRYRLMGDNKIDFNSTLVDPDLRGTGLASILAKEAVGDDIVKNRQVAASCWFIEGFLNKHPESLAKGASF